MKVGDLVRHTLSNGIWMGVVLSVRKRLIVEVLWHNNDTGFYSQYVLEVI